MRLRTALLVAIAQLAAGCLHWQHAQERLVVPAKSDALLNPAGERLLWETMQEWGKSNLWHQQFRPLRGYLPNDRDWNVTRNERTGIVNGRYMGAHIFFEDPAGHCQWMAVLLQQNEEGGRWSRPFLNQRSQFTEVTCDTVRALRPSPP